MFLKRIVLAGLTVLALETAGFGQTPPTPPVSPVAPKAPRALRGYSVVTQGMSHKGYLGVGVVDVNAERAKALKLATDSGVEVTNVDANSAASRAGLKENDVILEVNGQKMDEVPLFIKTISEMTPGSKAELTVWRNGAKQTVAATLDERPGFVMATPGAMLHGGLPAPRAIEELFPSMVADAPKVGFEGEMLTPQLAEFFGVKEGVLVRTVNAKSPAEKAGLKAGDVVTKVNGTPVTSPREVSSLLRASRKTAVFTVMRNHKEVTLNVEVAEDRNPGPDRLVL